MFKPIDYLKFSKCLIKGVKIQKNEALYRSIISRSYYSSLLTVREKIDDFNQNLLTHSGKRNTSHLEIIKNILNLPDNNLNYTQLKTLKMNMEELKNYRVNADYKFKNAKHPKEQRFLNNKNTKKILDPENERSAKYVLKSAQHIINKIKSI